jgi:hypothetical protein
MYKKNLIDHIVYSIWNLNKTSDWLTRKETIILWIWWLTFSCRYSYINNRIYCGMGWKYAFKEANSSKRKEIKEFLKTLKQNKKQVGTWIF